VVGATPPFVSVRVMMRTYLKMPSTCSICARRATHGTFARPSGDVLLSKSLPTMRLPSFASQRGPKKYRPTTCPVALNNYASLGRIVC
jgi:hypothetical protein